MKNGPYIFVLWGEHFDEQMAISFVTKFRSAGLRVKIVGLRGIPVAGIYGITLTPDLTLSQALFLAEYAKCVVIPCHSPYFLSIDNDPRVRKFFQKTNSSQAKYITGQVHLPELEKFVDLANVVRYFEYG